MSKKWLSAALMLCAMFFMAGTAHAKRGLGIVGYGDALYEVGPFPAKIQEEDPQARGFKVGYKCSHLAFMFADIWRWDCKMVGVSSLESRTYTDLPPEYLAELEKDPAFGLGKTQRNFWQQFGFYIMLVGIIAFALISSRKKKANEPEEVAQASE